MCVHIYIYIYIYMLYAWCKHVHVCTYTCAWVHIRCMLYSRVDVFGQSVMLCPTHGHPHACSQLCMHARRFSHPTFAHTKASLCMRACVRTCLRRQSYKPSACECKDCWSAWWSRVLHALCVSVCTAYVRPLWLTRTLYKP